MNNERLEGIFANHKIMIYATRVEDTDPLNMSKALPSFFTRRYAFKLFIIFLEHRTVPLIILHDFVRATRG